MKKLITSLVISSFSLATFLANLTVAQAVITNPEIKTSVIQIWNQETDGNWYTGSGVNISVDALFLTAAHVVIDSTTNQPSEHLEICVTYNEYSPPICEYSGQVYAYDLDLDLALVEPLYRLDENGAEYGEVLSIEEMQAIGLPYVDISDYEPALGDNITILGYPDATGSANLALTNGVVSNFETWEGLNVTYATDAIINPGNSGGPVYNSEEKLIGIAVATSTEGVGGNYGYVVAGDMIYLWFLDLVDQGYLNEDYVSQVFSNDFIEEEFAGVDISEAPEVEAGLAGEGGTGSGSADDGNTETGTVRSFPDVAASHLYYDAIMYLSSEGVVSGYPDGTFKPNQEVNRAEMMKILVESQVDESLFESYSDDSCFPDVAANQWYTKYICYGKTSDWVVGYTDGTFRPSQTITFVEALKITLRAFNLGNNETTNPWYKYNVILASDYNYIPFSVSSFNQAVTRAIMADLATRIKINTEDLSLDQAALNEYLGDRANFIVTYETLEARLDLSAGETLNIEDQEQDCPSGNQIYRNETGRYEFCYTEAGQVTVDDFFGTTFSLALEADLLSGGISIVSSYGLSLDEYLDISEVGTISDKTSFTNEHGTKGIEFDLTDEVTGWNEHSLMFENPTGTKIIKVYYGYPEPTDILLMQTIKDSFKFL